MNITFYKYQGTGNDFIIIDNRLQTIDKNNTKRIAELCDRRFGIGADGFILLENDNSSDFRMVYYNSDGNESSMCGNGGRCIVAFAKFLGVIENTTEFIAIDGLHKAKIEDQIVQLQMQKVSKIEAFKKHLFLDTGSPHHVELVTGLKDFEVKANGAKIRYGQPYNEDGSNVNFVEQVSKDTFSVRTYERGVEDETLSCGTGVTAVALAMHKIGKTESNTVKLNTPGGTLKITFNAIGDGYEDIWLIGPAIQVFKGEIEW
ncbi:diaminopimelate epimerase [Winogradskyella echinorum]|uniref:Diaminopimelate epimerase n=1 Tax=Winogradskyella echinorum TaxID=538189 RepID=A0ABR6Y5R3_9FLAO|nr:diaminopimelate epimerase [Winogradskyella echinorum]MBC3848055.1 diaminopimelate epimerase [Winogradskyella echinorum]MBC5752403.1 diaminopimelate epimerase [Winogradskyella echinorum]